MGEEENWVLDQLNLEGVNAWTANQQQAAVLRPNHQLHNQYMVVPSISQCADALIIKLSIQAVTMVSNHNQFYNRHAWIDT